MDIFFFYLVVANLVISIVLVQEKKKDLEPSTLY